MLSVLRNLFKRETSKDLDVKKSYSEIEIDVDEETMNIVKKIANKNGVSINQVLSDACSKYAYSKPVAVYNYIKKSGVSDMNFTKTKKEDLVLILKEIKNIINEK